MSSAFEITKATTVVEKKEIYDEEDTVTEDSGCGFFRRYPSLSIFIFACVGIGVGAGFSYWEPDLDDDQQKKEVILKWIGLVGDLFIRGLQCVIVPLVFINVTISITDMLDLGKAGSIGSKTIGLFLLSSILASASGILALLCFQRFFQEGSFKEDPPATISLGCNSQDGAFLTKLPNGTVICQQGDDDQHDTMFYVTDVTDSFVMTSKSVTDVSMSDTVYDGVFTKLVTSNITEAFASGNIAAIVIFAIVFGVAISRVAATNRAGRHRKSLIVKLFKELDPILLTMINWLIAITPVAVMSLVIKGLGCQQRLADSFSNVGFLIVATIVAIVGHFAVVQCGLFYTITRSSPYGFLKHILPAQTMAFACSSSAATIPMMLKCLKRSRRVPVSVSRFVIPMGVSFNMEGSAIYFPLACVWLARLNGIEPDIASYVLLVILSTIGSVGATPIPSAGLVMILTIYNTTFNSTGTPEGFIFILAIDWFLDRFWTTLNVTGDTFVAAMVASMCPMDDTVEMSCSVYVNEVDLTENESESESDSDCDCDYEGV